MTLPPWPSACLLLGPCLCGSVVKTWVIFAADALFETFWSNSGLEVDGRALAATPRASVSFPAWPRHVPACEDHVPTTKLVEF